MNMALPAGIHNGEPLLVNLNTNSNILPLTDQLEKSVAFQTGATEGGIANGNENEGAAGGSEAASSCPEAASANTGKILGSPLPRLETSEISSGNIEVGTNVENSITTPVEEKSSLLNKTSPSGESDILRLDCSEDELGGVTGGEECFQTSAQEKVPKVCSRNDSTGSDNELCEQSFRNGENQFLTNTVSEDVCIGKDDTQEVHQNDISEQDVQDDAVWGRDRRIIIGDEGWLLKDDSEDGPADEADVLENSGEHVSKDCLVMEPSIGSQNDSNGCRDDSKSPGRDDVNADVNDLQGAGFKTWRNTSESDCSSDVKIRYTEDGENMIFSEHSDEEVPEENVDDEVDNVSEPEILFDKKRKNVEEKRPVSVEESAKSSVPTDEFKRPFVAVIQVTDGNSLPVIRATQLPDTDECTDNKEVGQSSGQGRNLHTVDKNGRAEDVLGIDSEEIRFTDDDDNQLVPKKVATEKRCVPKELTVQNFPENSAGQSQQIETIDIGRHLLPINSFEAGPDKGNTDKYRPQHGGGSVFSRLSGNDSQVEHENNFCDKRAVGGSVFSRLSENNQPTPISTISSISTVSHTAGLDSLGPQIEQNVPLQVRGHSERNDLCLQRIEKKLFTRRDKAYSAGDNSFKGSYNISPRGENYKVPNFSYPNNDDQYYPNEHHNPDGGFYQNYNGASNLSERWGQSHYDNGYQPNFGHEGEMHPDYASPSTSNQWDYNSSQWNNAPLVDWCHRSATHFENRMDNGQYFGPSGSGFGGPSSTNTQPICDTYAEPSTSTFFSDDFLIDTCDRFFVDQSSVPAKPTYDNYNEDEVIDNNDPNWDEVRNLKTDSERYKSLRKRWGNLTVPNPRKNLTCHNFRRKNSHIKSLLRESSDKPVFTNGRKRKASATVTSECHGGKRLCTILDEKFAAVDRQTTEEIERLETERSTAMVQVDENRQAQVSDLMAAFGPNLLDEYFLDIDYRTNRKKDDIHRHFQREIDLVWRRKTKQMRELENAVEEMETFYKFYGEGDSNVHLSPDEVRFFVEQERMYDMYDSFYSN